MGRCPEPLWPPPWVGRHCRIGKTAARHPGLGRRPPERELGDARLAPAPTAPCGQACEREMEFFCVYLKGRGAYRKKEAERALPSTGSCPSSHAHQIRVRPKPSGRSCSARSQALGCSPLVPARYITGRGAAEAWASAHLGYCHLRRQPCLLATTPTPERKFLNIKYI